MHVVDITNLSHISHTAQHVADNGFRLVAGKITMCGKVTSLVCVLGHTWKHTSKPQLLFSILPTRRSWPSEFTYSSRFTLWVFFRQFINQTKHTVDALCFYNFFPAFSILLFQLVKFLFCCILLPIQCRAVQCMTRGQRKVIFFPSVHFFFLLLLFRSPEGKVCCLSLSRV